MTIEQRLAFLEQTHRELHERIDYLESESAPSRYRELIILELKKKKLQAKDAIERLKADIGI